MVSDYNRERSEIAREWNQSDDCFQGDFDTRKTGTHLKLKLTHPNCWMQDITSETDGRLLVTAVSTVEDQVKAHVVVYADSTEELDSLIPKLNVDPHVSSVTRMNNKYDLGTDLSKKAHVGLLVESDPENSIYEALVSRGFMLQGPIRVCNGWEHWTVAVDDTRSEIREKLADVGDKWDAAIKLKKINTYGVVKPPKMDVDLLSDRQYEVFELARERGYYDSPRRISGSELAEELNISKTTLHEHLRKVEAKLLGPSGTV